MTYAYIDGNQQSSRIHLVDLRTNHDKLLAEGGPWRIVGLRPDAVYVERLEYFDTNAYGLLAVSRGLWCVPSPDAPVKVWTGTNAIGPDYPIAVDGGVVWFSSRTQTPAWAIYRYSADRGLDLVANFTDHPVTVAGPCA